MLVPVSLRHYDSSVGLLKDKRILLGVSGGIAAYKTPELVRRLIDAGADVRVILTDAGRRFVSSLSLEVVSGHPVGQSLWDTDTDSKIVHTDIGQDADLIILAPATANLIGRIRHGLADDLLSLAVMASQTPVLICPSMNSDMLSNPIVQQNIDGLVALGRGRYQILEPEEGFLACGVVGPGRLPDPPRVIGAAAAALTPKLLAGVRVAVSAGPTHEAIDPVRMLTNRSTGTMGFELARAFAAAGADMSLVAGPVSLDTPYGVASRVDVKSAADMERAVLSVWPRIDVLVMTAAVADYRPKTKEATKIKKAPGPAPSSWSARPTSSPKRRLPRIVGDRSADPPVLVGLHEDIGTPDSLVLFVVLVESADVGGDEGAC